jgi:hypothetical protein
MTCLAHRLYTPDMLIGLPGASSRRDGQVSLNSPNFVIRGMELERILPSTTTMNLGGIEVLYSSFPIQFIWPPL